MNPRIFSLGKLVFILILTGFFLAALPYSAKAQTDVSSDVTAETPEPASSEKDPKTSSGEVKAVKDESGVENIQLEEIPGDKLPKPVIPLAHEEPIKETGVAEPKSPESGTPRASEEPAKAAEEKPVAVDPQVFQAVQRMTNPRATVEFFMENCFHQKYNTAVLTLDLSKLPEMSDDVKQDLAYKLCGILRRLQKFSPQRIPEETPNDVYYLWPDKRYNALILQKQKNGIWRFSPDTVADISRFYREIRDEKPIYTQSRIPFMRYVPSELHKRFFGLAYFEWIFIGAFLVLGYLACRMITAISAFLLLIPLRTLRQDEKFIQLTRHAIRPLAYLAMLYLWYVGFMLVQLPPKILTFVGYAIHPLCILLIMVAVLRITDIFGQWLKDRMVRSQNKTGNVLADLSTNSLKILFVCSGFIAVAQVYGFSALGILSGMGIGGIAVALAAQNTVANFFGSLMILMDRPFTVGDWIVADKIEGVVETVGLRSTRIRTFYNSLVVIPNSVLAAATIDNMERRYFRRYRAILNIRYNTPVDTLEKFCARVTEFILSYPNTKKTGVQVFVYDLSANSIDILVSCHFAAGTSSEENASRQRLIMDILATAEEMGMVFATTNDRLTVSVLPAPVEPPTV